MDRSDSVRWDKGAERVRQPGGTEEDQGRVDGRGGGGASSVARGWCHA